MHGRILSPSKELGGKSAATFNHETKHLVVGSARKEDFAAVEFKEGATY